MTTSLITFIAKTISLISRLTNLGNGSTWPGHIALKIHPTLIHDIISKSYITTVLVAGTNGKTTTAKLIKQTLEEQGKRVIQNQSGANLLNGIASTLILNANWAGKLYADYAIFEVDENTLPHLLHAFSPDYLILLNLFRDQLDRYGEIHTIATKWKEQLQKLTENTKLIVNADDPTIAYLGEHLQTKNYYFGLSKENMQHFSKTPDHAVDALYCPRCGKKLHYAWYSYSHLGDWQCTSCRRKRPKPSIANFSVYPLSGTYNAYNTLAAVLVLQNIGINNTQIERTIALFKPAFGRQEQIPYKGKKFTLFLSKNPTSFNQSYATIKSLQAKIIVLVLNDRIPDGRDISWIWDTDLADLDQFKKIIISGDRVFDMALRLKYELDTDQYAKLVSIEPDLDKAVAEAIKYGKIDEGIFILPTYSAMLDVRKILTGKKIL